VKPFDPRLLRYSRSSRGFIFSIILIGAIGALFTIAQAYLLVDLICRFFQHKEPFDSLHGEIIKLGLVFLARAILAFTNDRIAALASSKMRNELRSEIMKKTLDNNGSDSSELGVAGLAVLVTKGINNLDGYFAKFLPQLFIAVIVPITVGITIAIRDWKSGAIILLTIPLIPIFGILIGRFTASATEKKWETLGVLSGYFLDLLSGITTLKVYGREKLQGKKLKDVGERYRVETMKVLRISFLSSLALELIATLSVALLAVTIGLRLVDGSMPLSTGLFVLVLAPEVYWPIRQVSGYFHAASDGIAAFNQLFAILEKPERTGDESIDETTLTSISWSELTVHYPRRAEVKIPAGELHRSEVHALVGPSGSGKSTLAAVLLGFVTPSTGRVLIKTTEGTFDLNSLDIRSWRSFIAWQPQEPKFPIGSVTEILRHANPTASDDELVEALQRVDLSILDLPDGLQTELGTLQQKLSIGQLRKIALARALLKGAMLIILDEPTASVDDISESTISRLLADEASTGAMILLISHRELMISASTHITHMGAHL
jgi:ATP-binding cassette subfamily C protein CydCD